MKRREFDNSAYILAQAPHSARTSWIYIDGETFNGARADIGGDPNLQNPDNPTPLLKGLSNPHGTAGGGG